jgi:sulfoxide reductase heme-binding subunit YedZ
VNTYTDPSQHVFWLASRGLGVAALVLISLSVGLGLALSGRVSRTPGAPARFKRLHEAVALAGLLAIAGHGLTLLGDPYLKPGLAGIALPFAMATQPVWTGVGILGGWLAAIVGLSFYVRKWIGTKAWRRLHRWTLAVYVMSIAHTLGSGSDARSFWLTYILLASTLPILFLAVFRLLPAERKARREPQRRAVPRSGAPAEAPF